MSKRNDCTMKSMCLSGCCDILIAPYSNLFKPRHGTHVKAGVIVYDPDQDKLLLVQSRGRLWGVPKGSIKHGESIENCAIRELYEETGLRLSVNILNEYVTVKNLSHYYYVEMSQRDVYINSDIKNNDATGLTWIRTECMLNMIERNMLQLNYHTKIALHLVFRIPLRKLQKTRKSFLLLQTCGGGTIPPYQYRPDSPSEYVH